MMAVFSLTLFYVPSIFSSNGHLPLATLRFQVFSLKCFVCFRVSYFTSPLVWGNNDQH